MRKADVQKSDVKLAVCAESLASMLDCGRATAVKIGTEAGARVQVGRRILFKVDRVEKYLEGLLEV